MRKNILAYALAFALFGSLEPAYADPRGSAPQIGFDRKTGRPNIFIAWRNTARILEVEVEVKNPTAQQHEGHLSLQVLDEDNNILDMTPRNGEPPNRVVLPPAELGGLEGKIVQINGTKELNLLIDRLDRSNQRYTIKVDFVGNDGVLTPLVNSHSKTFNVKSRLTPDSLHTFEYVVLNRSEKPIEAKWLISNSVVPGGWQLSTSHADGSTSTMKPGQSIQGVLTLKTPQNLNQGQHLDTRVAVVDAKTNQIVSTAEWYTVRDIVVPEVRDFGYEYDPKTGLVSLHLTAADDDSMIKEASGVRVEYSTDGGVTFSSRILAYADGNFVGPTRFTADLGPFRPGTTLFLATIVEDIANNRASTSLAPLVLADTPISYNAAKRADLRNAHPQ